MSQIDKFLRRALHDEGLRARLTADPRAALADAGINVPENLNIKVAEDTADTLWIHLPRASSGELSTEELDSVAGGYHTAAFEQWEAFKREPGDLGGGTRKRL